MKHRFIVVEGPIGCGKTSLAKLLARRLNATAVLEEPEANPFLPLFYRDMRRHALSTQLFFLFQRLHQLEGLRQPDLFGRPTVADFALQKEFPTSTCAPCRMPTRAISTTTPRAPCSS